MILILLCLSKYAGQPVITSKNMVLFPMFAWSTPAFWLKVRFWYSGRLELLKSDQTGLSSRDTCGLVLRRNNHSPLFRGQLFRIDHFSKNQFTELFG
jgi:hypothetical protein